MVLGPDRIKRDQDVEWKPISEDQLRALAGKATDR
jgi:hypothetical protein